MEHRQYLNDDPGSDGEMSFEFDIAAGTLRLFGSGFWSVAQTRAFFDDWQLMVRRVHIAGRAVSGLVDMSKSAVQSAEVAEMIATATANIYHRNDAVAMLVPTNLIKMQTRRVLDPRFHGFFVSRNAAEMWLAAKSMSSKPPIDECETDHRTRATQ